MNDAHSTPLCAPSRYVFLSGNYQHRGVAYPGMWNLNYQSSQFKEGQKSIATTLKNEGYDTAMFGKWHIGGKNIVVVAELLLWNCSRSTCCGIVAVLLAVEL